MIRSKRCDDIIRLIDEALESVQADRSMPGDRVRSRSVRPDAATDLV